MKTFVSFFSSLLLFTLFFTSCNQSGQQTTIEAAAVDTTAAAPTPPAEPKNIAVVLSHHVHDFPMFRFVFDGQEQARQAAGLKTIGIFQDDSDPTYTSVTIQIANMDSAKKFIASEDFKTTLTKAGVTDLPEIKFYEFVYTDEAAAASSDNRMFRVMKVSDYDTFKKEYDAHESLRKERGILTVAIARNIDDPSEVAISETNGIMENLKKHAESPEDKEAMQKAGVTGEPYIQFAKKAAGGIL